VVSALTLGLALRPHRAPPPPSPISTRFAAFDVVVADPTPACASAHALLVRGHVTGGVSHVQLAGPIIYTDVTTTPLGDFVMRIPVDGNVCDLLPTAQHFAFEGDGMTVSYDIGFDR
jgi:hypothetical protein